MLDAAIVGLGWWGQELVKAIEGSPLLRFVRGVNVGGQVPQLRGRTGRSSASPGK